MKFIRTKISLFVVITFLAAAGIIVFYALYLSSSTENVKRNYAESQAMQLQYHLKMNSYEAGRAIRHLASAPDMNPASVAENGLPVDINYRIALAGFKFIAIASPELAVNYVFPGYNRSYVNLIPDSINVFKKSLSQGKVTIYYGWLHDSIYEVSSLFVKNFLAQGTDSAGMWIFAGRCMNHELNDKMMVDFPGQISILKGSKPGGFTFNSADNTFKSILPLIGWNSTIVAALELKSEPMVLKSLAVQKRNSIWMLSILAILFSAFIYVYLKRYYILPLRLISLAIKHKDPEYIRIISDKDPDVNSLQLMLMNVFNQETLLVDMIRRLTNEQLNSFHAAILSQINEAVYATDHKGIITYWNKAAEDLYGVEEQNAISKVSSVLIRTKWYDEDEENFYNTTLASAGIWNGKLVQEIPNGSEINVVASVTCLYDTNNELIGYLTIVRKPVH